MKCPYCFSTNLKVTDTRSKGDIIKRKRKCLDCGGTFYTIEMIDLSEIRVRKRNNNLQSFQKHKIISGINRAFNKLDISEDIINAIMSNIEMEIYRKKINVISSEEIGNIVLKYIKQVNDIAYLRFLSVYKRFNKIEEFFNEISKYIKEKGKRKGSL